VLTRVADRRPVARRRLDRSDRGRRLYRLQKVQKEEGEGVDGGLSLDLAGRVVVSGV
jgi:hypothetical protein